MNRSACLFALLRYALGTERPEDAELLCALTLEEWLAVYELAGQQNVLAIAFDGLSALTQKVPTSCLTGKRSDEDKWSDFVMVWSGNVFYQEQQFEQRWNVACKVADIWKQFGLKTFVLKGVSFAQCYPIPSHRYSCDIDLLPMYVASYNGGISAWELSNNSLADVGAKVDAREKKHSHIDYKGVHVENHQFVSGVKGDKKGRAFDVYMKQLLEDSEAQTIGYSNLLAPCPLFSQLLCIKHAQTHFLIEEGILLRYVLDWALLRSKEGGKDFLTVVDGFGLRKMYGAMDEVADYIFNRNETVLSQRATILLDDILAPKEHLSSDGSRFKAHVNILRTIWRRRKLYKDFSDITAIKQMWIYLKGYFGGI